MKTRFIRFALGVCICSVMATISVWGQSPENIRVSIPFGFIAGASHLPAGEYLIRPVSTFPTLLSIRGMNGQNVAMVFMTPEYGNRLESSTKLEFHRHGSDYVLSRFSGAGRGQGYGVACCHEKCQFAGAQVRVPGSTVATR